MKKHPFLKLPGRALYALNQWLYLRSAFGPRDAFRLASPAFAAEKILKVFSTELQRSVWLRGGTSDLKVALQVLAAREYDVDPGLMPRLIIDAGANIGISSLYFAAKYPEAKVYAIEPEPSNFRLLIRNCQGVSNIIPVSAALWPRPARLSLVDEHAEKWACSFRESDGDGVGMPSITIPEILAQAGADTIDVLKLDIEGAERELFSDSCESWLPKVRFIIIELHDRWVPGSSKTFYSKIVGRDFSQEIRGENLFVRFRNVP